MPVTPLCQFDAPDDLRRALATVASASVHVTYAEPLPGYSALVIADSVIHASSFLDKHKDYTWELPTDALRAAVDALPAASPVTLSVDGVAFLLNGQRIGSPAPAESATTSRRREPEQTTAKTKQPPGIITDACRESTARFRKLSGFRSGEVYGIVLDVLADGGYEYLLIADGQATRIRVSNGYTTTLSTQPGTISDKEQNQLWKLTTVRSLPPTPAPRCAPSSSSAWATPSHNPPSASGWTRAGSSPAPDLASSPPLLTRTWRTICALWS